MERNGRAFHISFYCQPPKNGLITLEIHHGERQGSSPRGCAVPHLMPGCPNWLQPWFLPSKSGVDTLLPSGRELAAALESDPHFIWLVGLLEFPSERIQGGWQTRVRFGAWKKPPA